MLGSSFRGAAAKRRRTRNPVTADRGYWMPGRPRYPVLVHRAAVLLHASFRPRLAATPLRFANPSPPSGWIEDLHLQAVDHARHTNHAAETTPWLGISDSNFDVAERIFISLNMRQNSDFPEPPQTAPSSRENNFLCEAGSLVAGTHHREAGRPVFQVHHIGVRILSREPKIFEIIDVFVFYKIKPPD